MIDTSYYKESCISKSDKFYNQCFDLSIALYHKLSVLILESLLKLSKAKGLSPFFMINSGKIEIDGIEISTPFIREIEFEREGEIEINFVPIRTGEFIFEIEGLQHKGMTGVFLIE